MIETILLAMLISKIKGYKLKPMLKSWAFYPALGFTLFYVFLQITIFCGYYEFIKYAGILETAYTFTFLFLIFKYELYFSAIMGSITIFIGTTLNKIVMSVNGGKMPVFPTLSYLTGYAKPDSFLKVKDIHILGNEATKLKLLTDYIDIGYSILSIGDIFIRFFTFIIIYNSIKCVNKRSVEKCNV
jgi:hypothetical protein